MKKKESVVSTYLSLRCLIAADLSHGLDLGLQLLGLPVDLLYFLSHFFTFLMDLVTLPDK